MNTTKPKDKKSQREETPVDDVRKIRERFDREAGGDIHKLAEQSRRAFEKYRDKLHLKLVTLPKGPQAAVKT